MNVIHLQQFLQTLIKPLGGSGAPQETLDALEKISQALEPVADRPVTELAVFLDRAHEYEQQGHWPQTRPSIQGELVDRPSPQEYADRLKAFLHREVPASGPMSEQVLRELDAIKAALKTDALRAVAVACGVTGRVSSANNAIEKVFEQVTGRKFPDSLMEFYRNSLLNSNQDRARIDGLLAKIQAAFTVAQIKKLAVKVGVQGTISSKPDGVAQIRNFLLPSAGDVTPSDEPPAPPAPQPPKPVPAPDKVNQIVEIVKALKEKADPDDAPHEEIEEELQRLEEQMSKEEAIAAAKQLGVAFGVQSKSDALKRLREKVFERKLVREKIRY